jgi:hypothetical protein
MTTQMAPPLDLDLLDGSRIVGWVRGWTVGFRGFANENEAAGAAWIAYKALARRLAHRHSGPPAPVDVEPFSLKQVGDLKVLLASGRPFATLIAPSVESLSGPGSFGFEIEVPQPADELSMRSLAYRIYRTLRASGVR